MEGRNGNGNGRVGRIDVCVNRYFQQVQGFIDGGCFASGVVDRNVRQIPHWVPFRSYYRNGEVRMSS